MKAAKLRTLVILTPGFPKNEEDSTCIPPQQIFVKALRETEPELNIIVLTFHYPFFSGEYLWHGVQVISFGKANQGKFHRLFTALRVRRYLKEIKKKYQIIGLLSFWLGRCAYVGHSFAKKHYLKHYSWLLGQDAKAGNKYFNKIRPEGKSLIALSDFIAAEVDKNYGINPNHTIPVGIDISLFGEAPAHRDIDILGAGSLIPLKQYSVFLEVVHLLKDTFPLIRTMICGNGPEMKHLQKRIAEMGLENNIILSGEETHAEVLSLMQRSKAFLHPSSYEGFGAVCLEALYAGAEVVSFVRPMKADIPNWHIVISSEDMVSRLQHILHNAAIIQQPVLPYTIQDNAKKMIALFK